MSSEWRETTFGNFVAIQRGHDLPDQDRRPGSVPILGSFGITGYHDTVKTKGPGVTVGRSGASFGVAAYTDHDYWPLNTALYVTDFKGSNPKFVFYFMRQFDFSGFNSGSAQPSLNRNNLYPVAIRIPEQSEQKAIAEFLGALDDRITLLRETNATLEAIAQALFKSWFVDFDPVRAKAEGLAPQAMDETTAALFPDSFEESELGLVPKGWQVGSLSDVCSIASGKRPPDRSDARTEACSIPLYGGAGLMGYTSATLFDEELIVTGRVGTLGKVHIAYPPFWASDNVLVLSPKLATDFSFTLHWIRSIDVHALNRGSTQPLLTQRDLGAQQGLIPPRGVLQQFEEIVAPLYVRMRSQELQAQTLTQLRDTLLPRLISGQLRLPEAETLIAAEGA